MRCCLSGTSAPFRPLVQILNQSNSAHRAINSQQIGFTAHMESTNAGGQRSTNQQSGCLRVQPAMLIIYMLQHPGPTPPIDAPPAPCGCGVWGVGCTPVLLQAFMHALHHVGRVFQQNAASTCTAVLQKPVKLCQIGPYGGFPSMSFRKPSNLFVWPCTIQLSNWPCLGGGPAMLDAETYICCKHKTQASFFSITMIYNFKVPHHLSLAKRYLRTPKPERIRLLEDACLDLGD